MRLIGDLLTADPVPTEHAITECWNALAALVETGRISEAQLRHLVRNEPPEDVVPIVRHWWLITLRRALASPGSIGFDPDALTYRCRCLDTGWITVSEEGRGTVHPCPECEPTAWRMWSACFRLGPSHRCERCTPGKRAPRTPEEAREDDRAGIENRTLDGLT